MEQKWEPISTAPKDGTTVDLWCKRWIPSRDKFEYKRFTDCWWTIHPHVKSEGYWYQPPNTTELHNWFPTHWMPIPEGPSTKNS